MGQQSVWDICHCGKPTAKRMNNRFCSDYCELFKESGISLVKGRYPAIPVACNLCGTETNATLGEGYVRHFCSHACKKQVLLAPIKRPLMNYYLLFSLKKHGGWLNAEAFNNRLAIYGQTGNTARWANFLARWSRYGIVEVRQDGHSPKEYRFNPNIKTPVGRIIVQKGA